MDLKVTKRIRRVRIAALPAPIRLTGVPLLFLMVACIRPLYAHGDLHLQILALSPRIHRAPTADLFVKRGELHQLDGDVPAALADFQRAEKLDPDLEALHMARGRTFYEAKSYPAAMEALDRLLAAQPNHPDGLICRARTRAALGLHAPALADYDHLIEIVSSPPPDAFLERAASQVSLNRPQDALRGLDQGIDRLGNLPIFQEAALQIEIDLKQYDMALDRLDRVIATMKRKEFWMVRRGDILEAAGRTAEARTTRFKALQMIAALPPFHRTAPNVRALESRVEGLLAATNPPECIHP